MTSHQIILTYSLIYSLSNIGFSQDSTKTQSLDEVIVTANFQENEIRKTARNISVISAKDIENAPVKTLDGILQYALNVDVRSRGPLGVQADISIRGGHYDQTLILLDGVKLNDPQTGHHSLNLPISMDQIERIEVLQGGGSRVYGPAAFSGIIHIISKKNQKPNLNLGFAMGEFGLNKFNFGAVLGRKKINSRINFENIGSEGFSKNTAFKRSLFSFGTNIKITKSTEFDLNTGFFSNKFGAANYYFPSKYDQYEEVESALLVASIKQNIGNNFTSSFTASFREHSDMYDFDNYRTTTTPINKFSSINFHQTKVFDYNWINKLKSDLGTTSFGLEYRIEDVISNRLGDILQKPIKRYAEEGRGYQIITYDKGKKRKNISAYFEHFINKGKTNIAFGTLLNFNSQFGTNLYPGIDLSYAITERKSLYTSINRSLRFPTFTEMYLVGSTVVGDPNLKPEDAWTYEIGLKHKAKAVNWTTAIFYKHSNSAIDKVKRPELAVPTMENIGDMNTRSFEFNTQLNINALKGNSDYLLQNIKFNYAYLNVDKKEASYQSFYTLNYLKNKASFGINWRIAKNVYLDTWYTYKARAGQYQWDSKSPAINYTPINLVDSRINFQQKFFRIFLDATNIFNKTYYEFGFVEQPKRWLSGGVSVLIK